MLLGSFAISSIIIILSIILMVLLAILYDKLDNEGQKIFLGVISGIIIFILLILGIILLSR